MQCLGDRLENAFGIAEDVIVPKPDHAIPALLEPTRAGSVVCAVRMLAAE